MQGSSGCSHRAQRRRWAGWAGRSGWRGSGLSAGGRQADAAARVNAGAAKALTAGAPRVSEENEQGTGAAAAGLAAVQDPAGACRIRRGGGREWNPDGPRQVGDGNRGAPGPRRSLVIADRGEAWSNAEMGLQVRAAMVGRRRRRHGGDRPEMAVGRRMA